MGSGREMYAGSGATALPARATSSGSSVSGSKRTIAVGRSGAPAIAATEPADTTMLSNSVNGEATSPTSWSWRMWSSRSRPSLRATATMLPSARNAYDERPNTHAGSANSASVGASASSRGPSARRYRFHQPLRSLAKWSSPSADHSRLGDRLVDPAGRQLGRPERPVGGDRRDPQPGGVPRHVGVVPLEPGEPVAGRRQARRGDEVRAADEDRRGRLAIEGNGDQLVPWLAFARMVLANREEAPPRSVEAHVGVAVRPGRRDRDRHRRARIDPVQPPVAELGIDDDAAGHRVRPAAVLVGARPDVGRGRRQLRRLAIGLAADEDPPAALCRMALDPVQVVAIEPRLAEQDRLLDDLLDRDRRAP